MSIVYFIILIGVLIFVHEFGHFVFAKLFGVKVLRFSIGMGPRLLSYQHGETEYTICWLPLGGYVQMLGFEMSELEDIPEQERDRALMMQPLWQRSIISLAGPVFNLVLPVVIYFCATMAQTTMPAAVIGEVFAETPAARAGLQTGDRIVAIDDEDVTYWYQFSDIVSDAYDHSVDLTYERDGARNTVSVAPEKKTSTDALGLLAKTRGVIGVHQRPQGPTVGIPNDQSPAARAGLETFDKVVSVDGDPIDRLAELNAAIRQSNGDPLDLLVLQRSPIDTDYGRFYRQRVDQITADPTRVDDHYSLGLESAEMYLSKVAADSPAARAGLETGDKLLALDSRTYSNFTLLNNKITNDVNKEVVAQQEQGADQVDVQLDYKLTFQRNGRQQVTTISPTVTRFKGKGDQEQYRIYLGWGHLSDRAEAQTLDFPLFSRMAYAAEVGVDRTAGFGKMIVLGFVRMAQGRVSLDNLGGPIMIGELAAEAGKAGWKPFLQMMALISINLGIINLLPIPVLDGGHLVLYALEGIKRGPLSYRTRQIAAYIGIAMIVFLMVLAFKNDIERNWADIAEWINHL